MQQNEYLYGRRQITTYDIHGKPLYSYSPLKKLDFLNPQEGDTFELGSNHERDVVKLYRIFQNRYKDHPSIGVYRTIKLLWKQPELAQPAPDLIIAARMIDPELKRPLFDVQNEKTLPRTIIEVVSPLLAEIDYNEKRSLYEEAGVEEYILVDSKMSDDQSAQANYTIVGYRLVDGLYSPLEADKHGRIHSKCTGTLIGPTSDGRDFEVVSDGTELTLTPADVAGDRTVSEVQGERRGKSLASALEELTKGGLGL